MKHTIRQELHQVATFVGVMWIVYGLDWIVPIQFDQWGIVPRTLWGIAGIPLAPFLHGGLSHLVSNTIPLTVLLVLLAGSRTRTWPTVAEIILLGGGLLWVFGRFANHVGASLLIYGLIAFLIMSGFREKRFIPLLTALLVGFFYGGTLLSGILPTSGPQISWDGHLCGAIAGGFLGYINVSAEDNASSEPSGATLDL